MTLYLASSANAAVRTAVAAGYLGALAQPGGGNPRAPGRPWAADNGCFGAGFDEGRWWRWLEAQDRAGCLFAVAPDVPFDAAASSTRSLPWLPRIRQLGFPAAYVIQDGQEHLPVPWDRLDAVFIGGTTTWKLGAAARVIAAQAKDAGKHLHMGRVNSLRRFRYAQAIGCDTADGTFLSFGPDINLPELLGWVRDVHSQTALDLDLR